MAKSNRDPLELAREKIEECRRQKAFFLDLNGLGLLNCPDISFLNQLLSLSLSQNRLMATPDLSALTHLQHLYLYSNRLTRIPDLSIHQQLQHLYLHDNSLLPIPPEVLGPSYNEVFGPQRLPRKPAKDIIRYLERVKQSGRALLETKLVLVGDGEVGKTSLMKRLVTDDFDPNEPPTHGINLEQWPMKVPSGETVTLNVWDFGGQDIMHATHQCFLSARCIYLVVVNARAGLADERAEYWLELVRSFGGNSPVVVVMNKVRLYPDDLSRRRLQEKFPGVRFARTDCGDTALGIGELKETIRNILDGVPHWRYLFPTDWFGVKDRLLELMKAGTNFVTETDYRQICVDNEERDPEAQTALAGYLHDLGIALNFKDDPRLKNRHVLNPHWVTKGIYSVLTSEIVKKAEGKLRFGDLKTILDPKDFPDDDVCWFVLELMLKFRICYAVSNRLDMYIVPDVLPKDQPADLSAYDPALCLNFEYAYTVLPEGLLPRFIALTHWYSDDHPWRYGVILTFDECRALVRADTTKKRIAIHVSGPEARRRGLLALIRGHLDIINADFKHNPPVALVPLPNHPDKMLSYDDLRARENEKSLDFSEVIGGKVVKLNASKLLEGIDPRDRASAGPRLNVFTSYAHKDESHQATLRGYLADLVVAGKASLWDDRLLVGGEDWSGEIDNNLTTADVVILLVSKNFQKSNYCMTVEVPAALKRRDEQKAVIVPVILDDVDWKSDLVLKQIMATTNALPVDGRPVRTGKWPNQNEAWRHIAAGFQKVIDKERQKRSKGT